MAAAGPIVAIVAGEASGDLLGGHLITALKAIHPEAKFVGIGGPKMQAAGMDVLFPMEKLAVRGYVEVLKHYREIVGIRKQLRQRWLNEPPALFIGIDAPDFNLDLETALKASGTPTIHYVGPSIWAWRGGRIKGIKRAVSKILVLFPFEPPIYERAGIPVSFIGHPLADELPEMPNRPLMREQMRLPQAAPVYALLPGSRQSEVKAHADLFVLTAKKILESQPEARFLVPLATRETRLIFEEAIWRHEARELPISLLFGHAHEAMIAANAVLVASGTATLEAALLKRPMVITYKMPRISWWLMKRMAYQPYVGLPNILAGKFLVPEFLQDAAQPDVLAQALIASWADKEAAAALEAEFLAMHKTLKQGTAARAAAAIAPFLQ